MLSVCVRLWLTCSRSCELYMCMFLWQKKKSPVTVVLVCQQEAECVWRDFSLPDTMKNAAEENIMSSLPHPNFNIHVCFIMILFFGLGRDRTGGSDSMLQNSWLKSMKWSEVAVQPNEGREPRRIALPFDSSKTHISRSSNLDYSTAWYVNIFYLHMADMMYRDFRVM